MALASSFSQLDSSASISDHVDAYLARPRYSGRCSFDNRTVVKRAGAKFDGDTRKWCAPNETVLRELLETGIWAPDCDIAAAQMSAILSMREETARREKHSKECAERKRVGPTEAQSESYIAEWLGIPKSTPSEIEALAPWNISPALLELSAKEPRLGPRSGLSNAARLFMGLDRGWLTPDQIGTAHSSKEEDGYGKAKRSKLPTLSPFGKRSFSRPRGNGGMASVIKEWNGRPRALYNEHDAHNLNRPYVGPIAFRISKCDICGGDSDEQFPCECVETKMALAGGEE